MRRKEERKSAFLLADDESDDDYVYNHSVREGDNDEDTLHISLDRSISSSSSSSSSSPPPPSLSFWPFFLLASKDCTLTSIPCFVSIGSRLTLLLPLMLVKLALETSHQRRSCSNMRLPKCTENEYRSSQRRKLAPARDNNKSTPKHYLHRRRKSLEAFLVNDSIDSNHGGKLNIICSIDAYCLKNA